MGAIEDRIKSALFAEQQPTASAPEAEPEQISTTEYQDDEAETLQSDTATESDLYKVKINGEEKEVTLDDLRKGYMMEADYRRKTSEVSEQRKAIEAKQAELEEAITEAKSLIDFELSELESDDMKSLREYDPQAYWKKVDQVKAKADRFNRRNEQHRKALEEKRQEALQKEREALFQKVPDWLDSEKQSTELRSIGAMLTDLGYTQEEAASITDHRIWALARKAMLYEQLSTADVKSKQVKKAPKSAEPGVKVPQGTNAERAIKDKRAQLRKTGSVRDAQSVLKSILNLG